ncbi:histidine kinase [Luteibacter aegosomatis]|uniref:sensor histidine kinase n=1 Tax=Luteibacter aegosomatis TaxID=2911537 RepID=UPI001FF7FE5F|nr:histidine kinase [Luteibacter aegosomatis]UPG85626.1 histidine kinase [Luteibacter aegosomatis]
MNPPERPIAFDPFHTRLPLWMVLLAGSPIVLCMAIMGLPELAYEHAAAYRTLFALTYLFWSVPVAALQRALWRRVPTWVLIVAMLAATYVCSVINNVLAQLMAMHWGRAPTFTWTRNLSGLDGCWLALIAFCAIHAVVAHAYELRAARERLREAEGFARDAELRALRYQLNPHFLFNTLNAISSLVTERRNDDASRMLSTLGDLLRATLDGGHAHEVSVAEELATTQLYLDIEKVRLGERLRLDVRAGPDVLRARVPSLLIQPLAENAIRHGIARLREPGRLDLHVSREGHHLRIALSNDGPPPEPRAEGRSIGLANVRQRLFRLYGDDQRVDLAIGDDGGCRVDIVLPFMAADAREPA